MVVVIFEIYEPGRQPRTVALVDIVGGTSIEELKKRLIDERAIIAPARDWKVGRMTQEEQEDGETTIGTKYINSPFQIWSDMSLLVQRIRILALMVELDRPVGSRAVPDAHYHALEGENKRLVVFDTCTLINQIEAKGAADRPLNDKAHLLVVITPRVVLEWNNYRKNKDKNRYPAAPVVLGDTLPLVDNDYFGPYFSIARKQRMWVIFYTSVLAGFDFTRLDPVRVKNVLRRSEYPGNVDTYIKQWGEREDAPGRKLQASVDEFKSYLLDPARTKSDFLILLECAAAGLVYRNLDGPPIFFTQDIIFGILLW